MTENAVTTTVTEFPYTIEGLTPATRYYVRMQQLCRTEEGVEIVSDWSEKQTFVTPYHYRFNEAERIARADNAVDSAVGRAAGNVAFNYRFAKAQKISFKQI